MSFLKSWFAIAAVGASVAALPLHASVVVSGTRVVYAQRDREVTVRLTNEGELPALVQAWIDDGNADADPATINVPFTLTPPMFRVEPSKGQSLRLIYTQEPLPAEKESVFWLNVLEVPPRPQSAADANMIQLAFRTRIKLFFRPAGLAGKPEDAPAKLQWRVEASGDGQVVRVSNPSAHHVSISQVGVTVGGKSYQSKDGGMVAPGSTIVFPVAASATPMPVPADASDAQKAAPVQFTWINDYGATVFAASSLGSGA